MGVSDSKPERLSAEERVSRDSAKSDLMEQRKLQIDQAQRQMLSSGSTAIVEAKDMVTFIKVTDKAKQQLDRSGDVLVKTDLIAILVALDPSLQKTIGKLESLRVSDLNAMIRSIIYDPARVIKSVQNASISTIQQTSSVKLLR